MSAVESWRLDARRKTEEALAKLKIPQRERKAEYSKTVDEETEGRRGLVLENAVLFL
jgi:hypothetical protein